MFLCVGVLPTYVFPMLAEVRDGHRISWDLRYRWLWATTWVLGIKHRCAGRAASLLGPESPLQPPPPMGHFSIFPLCCSAVRPSPIYLPLLRITSGEQWAEQHGGTVGMCDWFSFPLAWITDTASLQPFLSGGGNKSRGRNDPRAPSLRVHCAQLSLQGSAFLDSRPVAGEHACDVTA